MIAPKRLTTIICIPVNLLNKYITKKTNIKPIVLLDDIAKLYDIDLGDKVIMFHGVSVGEVIALENLIKKTNLLQIF